LGTSAAIDRKETSCESQPQSFYSSMLREDTEKFFKLCVLVSQW